MTENNTENYRFKRYQQLFWAIIILTPSIVGAIIVLWKELFGTISPYFFIILAVVLAIAILCGFYTQNKMKEITGEIKLKGKSPTEQDKIREKFMDMVKEFRVFCNMSHENSIYNFINKINQENIKKFNKDFLEQHWDDMDSMTNDLLEDCIFYKGDIDYLYRLFIRFENIVDSYSEFAGTFKKFLKEENPKITDDIKDQYKVIGREHNSLCDRYKVFVEDIGIKFENKRSVTLHKLPIIF